MKESSWISLHYALRLQNKITVKTLKTAIKTIAVYIVYVTTSCLIVASLSSCATTQQKHYNNHVSYKMFSEYKNCSAYGRP